MYGSILTSNHERCYKCGRTACEWHHIIHGTKGNKKLSEQYGLMVPLCRECHTKVHHSGGELDRELKEDSQRALLIEIFGRCYL